MQNKPKRQGVITRGSLTTGLEMKLDSDYSIEDIRAGKFVVIDGESNKFFSIITDVRLDATNPQILINPPAEDNILLRQILKGTSTYGTVFLKPMLMSPKRGDEAARLVKTIPVHFSQVFEATKEDVSLIFGDESSPKHFNIGNPLDMDEVPVCMDLDRFVERSNAIFGKTGTGKTFLTRVVLSGIINKGRAVNLIFDMHSEYGWQARQESEGGSNLVKGLKQLFGSKVAIFSLDPESSLRRGVHPDYEVKIPFSQIRVEDIALLQDELRLHSTAVETAYLLVARYGPRWILELLKQEPEGLKDFADELGAHKESISALYRKLSRLEQLTFLQERVNEDTVNKIMEYIDKGIHIVLEFGTQSSMLAYMLVANIITRRIHEKYVRKAEKYLATNKPEDKPKPLLITLEEAHKFLNPKTARQTIFGTIAREMRKYFVSLLIVDQRPSGIDDEILSQVGTRIIALLSDEKDINAVLTGVSNPSGLRSVLASLDSKQQVLVLGHAVPMPIVIQTRTYDTKFYKDMGLLEGEELKKAAEKNEIELFGSD